MTDKVETRTNLDHKRFQDGFRNAIKRKRNEQVEMMHREQAWKWLLKTHVAPMLEGIEHIQAFFNDDLSYLDMQLYGYYTDQIEEIVSRFMDNDNWRSGHEFLEKDKDPTYYYISKYDDTVEYKFYPDGDLWKYMSTRFTPHSSYAYVFYEVKFSFFIPENAECEIVELGTEAVTEMVTKIGLKCK